MFRPALRPNRSLTLKALLSADKRRLNKGQGQGHSRG
jgi:hypothetical protein